MKRIQTFNPLLRALVVSSMPVEAGQNIAFILRISVQSKFIFTIKTEILVKIFIVYESISLAKTYLHIYVSLDR